MSYVFALATPLMLLGTAMSLWHRPARYAAIDRSSQPFVVKHHRLLASGFAALAVLIALANLIALLR